MRLKSKDILLYEHTLCSYCTIVALLRTGQNNRTHVDLTSPESSLNVGVSTNSNLRKQKVETVMGAIIWACTKYAGLAKC